MTNNPSFFQIIRKPIHAVSRIPDIIRYVFRLIKEIGGIGVFIRKTVDVFKKDGFIGGIRKTRYILNQAFIGNIILLELHSYEKWIDMYCSLSEMNLLKLTERVNYFKYKPLISIILPTYNSKPEWLTAAIESVRDQIYPFWELCIADDASESMETKRILKQYEATDSRIKVKYRHENGHISKASNSALELASGDFIALLDHDDLLTKDALFRVADSISKNPLAALIYSDEDKIDESQKFKEPYFKCDWNYHLFLSQNLISHLGVYKTSVVRKIGGFRTGFEGSQDYDLALRFIEQINDNQITHIPRVLYHWRIHEQSTAKKSDSKPYAVKAAKKAIAEHLSRKNINAEVEILSIQLFRVKYKLPAVQPKVSIIIPTRNNRNILKKCVQSMLNKTSYNNFEIIVVDNNSDEPETLNYFQELKNESEIQVLKDRNEFNFSAINNRAVKNADGEYVLFLNDDTEVIHSEWLSEMVSVILQDGIGVAGAKLWYSNNTIQHAGIVLGISGAAGHAHKHFPKSNNGYFGRANAIQEFSAVTGACLLVNKKVFNEVGGFDEDNLVIAYNDIDLCLKIRALGYKIVWTPYAELVHHESYSRGDDVEPEKKERLNREKDFIKEKWGRMLKNDPAYSPNLTLEAENFGLAWPPRINSDVNDF